MKNSFQYGFGLVLKLSIILFLVNCKPKGNSMRMEFSHWQMEQSSRENTKKEVFIYNGRGMKNYPNKTKSIGERYSGIRHGVGNLTDETGKLVLSGIWRDDEFLQNQE
jgi:hypothetical protein